ncbi:MAG: hypothetical protein ACPL7M_09305 [Bryobacteraceae bacterium]
MRASQSWILPSPIHPRQRLWFFAILGALLLHCGSPAPGPEQAAQAILASVPFSSASARVVRLPAAAPGGCPQALASQPEWSRWTQLGLASLSPVMTSAGPSCRLVLEEVIAREAESWIHRVEASRSGEGDGLVVPVAVRTLLRVVEVHPTGSGAADVAFEWQWRLNAAGQRLGIQASPKVGTAQLVLEDGRWRAARVDVGGE